jgi:hypothetical protein
MDATQIEQENQLGFKIPKYLSESNFIQLPNLLLNELRDGKLQWIDIIVYIILISFKSGKNNVYPANYTIAIMARKAESTIRASLQRLADRGHIRREILKGTKRRNIYFNTFVGTDFKIYRGTPVNRTKRIKPKRIKPESPAKDIELLAEAPAIEIESDILGEEEPLF